MRRFPILTVSALAALIGRAAAAQVDTTQRPGVSVRLNYDAGTRPGVIVLPVRGADGDSIRAILQRDLADDVLQVPRKREIEPLHMHVRDVGALPALRATAGTR